MEVEGREGAVSRRNLKKQQTNYRACAPVLVREPALVFGVGMDSSLSFLS